MDSEQKAFRARCARLFHRPEGLISGMISVSDSPKLPPPRRESTSSTLGQLDQLPLELLLLVSQMLDMQSLSRFSQVSLRGHAVVQSSPAYRELLSCAPEAMSALSQTRTLRYHSASMLQASLRSEKCVSCGRFGVYLFLPTCERCCYECLERNQSLWVIPIAKAGKCFKLSARQMEKLPFILKVFGPDERVKLVSVKDAKIIANRRHRSLKSTERTLRSSLRDQISECEAVMFRWLQAAPLQPLNRDLDLLPRTQVLPQDNYPGQASVFFPSMSRNKEPEFGIWCRGCDWINKHHQYHFGGWVDTAVDRALSDTISKDFCLPQALEGMRRRARTTAEFLEHVKHCTKICAKVMAMSEPSSEYDELFGENTFRTTHLANSFEFAKDNHCPCLIPSTDHLQRFD